jgi:hypothetical protein
MTTWYKVLGEHGETYHGGTGKWYRPHGKRPGKWMPEVKGTVECCQRGYHLITASQLIEWLGSTLWVAEGRGDTDIEPDKTAFRQARLLSKVEVWNDRTARIFACDCAERVLPLFEKRYPNDRRPRTAIEVARKFADGKASKAELVAARDAAWDAARDAAWDAASDAASDAARAAAWDAARDAARAAAWAAARAAARDAARDAAWDAASDAAWAAARAAARDAAWAAERKWQTTHLCEMLGIKEE